MTFPTHIRVTQVPSGVRRQGHRLEGQSHSTNLIAILIQIGDQDRVRFAHYGRRITSDTDLRPEVQSSKPAQRVREIHAWDGFDNA